MRKYALFCLSILFLTILTSVNAQEGQTYYVSVRAAKIRSEASTASETVTTLKRHTPLVILEVVNGQSVSGSRTWYRINASGVEGYIHSSLVTASAPAPANGSSGSSGSSSSSTPNTSTGTFVVPESARASSSGCPNLGATCSALTCDEAYACLRAGNGRLDRDNDGVPCESVCPGG